MQTPIRSTMQDDAVTHTHTRTIQNFPLYEQSFRLYDVTQRYAEEVERRKKKKNTRKRGTRRRKKVPGRWPIEEKSQRQSRNTQTAYPQPLLRNRSFSSLVIFFLPHAYLPSHLPNFFQSAYTPRHTARSPAANPAFMARSASMPTTSAQA